MKKLLLLSTFALTATVTFGQGVVLFSNASTSWSPADNTRLNRFTDSAIGSGLNVANQRSVAEAGYTSGSLVVSNGLANTLRAQLYWGAVGSSSFASMQAVTAAPATFRSSTSANSGSWNGGNRTVPSWV